MRKPALKVCAISLEKISRTQIVCCKELDLRVKERLE